MLEDINELKQELSSVEKTLAMEMLEDARKASKRFFIIWVITFVAFLGLLGYTIYLLNDIGTIETIQEIDDVDSIGGDVVNNGDING